jgi:hypothetical protein
MTVAIGGAVADDVMVGTAVVVDVGVCEGVIVERATAVATVGEGETLISVSFRVCWQPISNKKMISQGKCFHLIFPF